MREERHVYVPAGHYSDGDRRERGRGGGPAQSSSNTSPAPDAAQSAVSFARLHGRVDALLQALQEEQHRATTAHVSKSAQLGAINPYAVGIGAVGRGDNRRGSVPVPPDIAGLRHFSADLEALREDRLSRRTVRAAKQQQQQATSRSSSSQSTSSSSSLSTSSSGSSTATAAPTTRNQQQPPKTTQSKQNQRTDRARRHSAPLHSAPQPTANTGKERPRCTHCHRSVDGLAPAAAARHLYACAYRKVRCLRCGERCTAKYIADHTCRITTHEER